MAANNDKAKEVMREINERVREIRKKNGLTMAEFAKRIGVSSGNVGDWESPNKSSSPSPVALIAIASEFNVSLDWLMTGKDKRTEDPIFFRDKWENSYQFIEEIEGRETLKSLVKTAAALADPDVEMLQTFATRLTRTYIREEAASYFYEDIKKNPLSDNKEPSKIREKNLPDQYYVRLPLIGKVSAGNPITAIENFEQSYDIPRDFISRNSSRPINKRDYFVLRVQGESMINAKIYDGNLVIVKRQPTAENGEIVVVMLDNEDVTVKTFYREDSHIRLQPENDSMDPIICGKDRDVRILGIVIGVYRLED
ncbi:transcriptional repressor LexA [Paenibacillus naphthalenovorans]|uniref:transcriptional repressor LexA n=1 Tax=Paenibacillus naphthalenovorans TaxID=162209 RepID=UPI000881F124|nr:transcriptional repressor LexA [Paenibacillus naphthalenovorans]SDI50139.1 SOS regulatory protein LexA [Paenibacillus naphthalenovorans]